MFHIWKSSINHRTFGRGQTWDIEDHFITELTRENSMWKKKILVNHVWPLLVNHATLWTVARQAPLPFLCPWNSPGKNTGVGSHSLLQGSSWPRDQTQVSHIAGGFFTMGSPLYSTKNFVQYPVINHNGKNILKNVLESLNHFSVQQKLTLWINYTSM